MKDDDAVEPTSLEAVDSLNGEAAPPPLPLSAAGAWNRDGDMSGDDDGADWLAHVAPAPGSKYEVDEKDALRVLSDDRPDADVMSAYLTNLVADNPEYERAVEAAFMAEEDKERQRRLVEGYTRVDDQATDVACVLDVDGRADGSPLMARSTHDAVGTATADFEGLAPPSAGRRERGEKSKRGEGVPAVVSEARSPLKRADDDEGIKSPARKVPLVECSGDAEGDGDALAQLRRATPPAEAVEAAVAESTTTAAVAESTTTMEAVATTATDYTARADNLLAFLASKGFTTDHGLAVVALENSRGEGTGAIEFLQQMRYIRRM